MVTLGEVEEIVLNRANGSYTNVVYEPRPQVSILGEWRLLELEALYLMLFYTNAQRLGLDDAEPISFIDRAANDAFADTCFNIVKDHEDTGGMNISSGKGGRVWLDGVWSMIQLGALCITIRRRVGAHADGVEEHIAYWKDAEERGYA
jgi:hypothetical protein